MSHLGLFCCRLVYLCPLTTICVAAGSGEGAGGGAAGSGEGDGAVGGGGGEEAAETAEEGQGQGDVAAEWRCQAVGGEVPGARQAFSICEVGEQDDEVVGNGQWLLVFGGTSAGKKKNQFALRCSHYKHPAVAAVRLLLLVYEALSY